MKYKVGELLLLKNGFICKLLNVNAGKGGSPRRWLILHTNWMLEKVRYCDIRLSWGRANGSWNAFGNKRRLIGSDRKIRIDDKGMFRGENNGP